MHGDGGNVIRNSREKGHDAGDIGGIGGTGYVPDDDVVDFGGRNAGSGEEFGNSDTTQFPGGYAREGRARLGERSAEAVEEYDVAHLGRVA